MTKDEFLQAKLFMFSDVDREIELAKADRSAPKALRDLGITAGAGNFLAALGLLCYTEFGGKLLFAAYHKQAKPSQRFNEFFNLLGPPYKTFRSMHDVYSVFRCGLAHEFNVKKSCDICMLEAEPSIGVGIQPDGKYFFIVESYCRDLKKAFDDLQVRLYDP